jgi:hypothetical protein
MDAVKGFQHGVGLEYLNLKVTRHHIPGLFYRFDEVEKLFCRWAQEQTDIYMTGAFLLLVLTMA